ncbi:MAG: flagellar biosynthesis protein FlhF [Gallionella sp.]
MNIRKFVAPTARLALREIRNELGSEAVILSNRKMANGVEIIAVANDSILKLAEYANKPKLRDPAAMTQQTGNQIAPVQAELATPPNPLSKPRVNVDVEKIVAPKKSDAALESTILGELSSLRKLLQTRLDRPVASPTQQLDKQRAGLLRTLLNSGFSSVLSRKLLDAMPPRSKNGEAWIKQVLKRNLLVPDKADDIVTTGGVYALIGPTGVGKTTTTAKLAARGVVRFGVDKVALLTTDSYRIGAYDQLKIYGRILGLAVHAVKDADDLRLTISSLRDKHLILIDTVGMGQRDERVTGQNEILDAAGVSRILLLNATCDGDTLDDVVRMYEGAKAVACIPTKLDEAVNIGMVLDVAVRHHLMLHYMANGQRVPEDLHPINLDYLLHRAFRPVEERTAFSLPDLDLPAVAGTAAGISSADASYAH